MTEPKKGMQIQLILMIGMLVGVMLAGYWLLPKDDEARDALLLNLGTTNHGTFISPLLAVSEIALEGEDGQAWDHASLKPKWRLLIAGDGQCLEECREMVYLSRQVHLRLGKYSQRFERFYIAKENQLSEDFVAYLQEHPYLKMLFVDESQWQQWLAQSGVVETGNSIAILVDQGGNAMMHYDVSNSGTQMLEDLNHLMKYSPGK